MNRASKDRIMCQEIGFLAIFRSAEEAVRKGVEACFCGVQQKRLCK
jgi:hypothetical protein